MMLGWGVGWGVTGVETVLMLLFWGVVVALAVLLIRTLAGPRTAGQDAATESLRRRLAAGEITAEEYERIRSLLGR